MMISVNIYLYMKQPGEGVGDKEDPTPNMLTGKSQEAAQTVDISGQFFLCNVS